MKKLLSVILAVMMLFSAAIIPAHADGVDVEVDVSDQFIHELIDGFYYDCGDTDNQHAVLTGVGEDNKALAELTIPVTVTYGGEEFTIRAIAKDAFAECVNLTTINYAGNKAEWRAINIVAEGNTALTNATINYTLLDNDDIIIPVAEKITETSIKLVAVDGCEYAIEAEPLVWQDSPVFEGLTPGCPYIFLQRYKETDTHKASGIAQEYFVTKEPITNIYLSTTSYTYDGSVKTPSVIVKDSNGEILNKDSDYTVTYASGRKTVGTYKVTVNMIGDYTGTKTLTFKINPASLSTCTLSTTSYTYDGSVKTPSVTVKNSKGTTLTKDASYTVTYASGRKNVGSYTVTIKGKGNYTGTKTLIFKINAASIGTCKLSTTSYTYNGSVKTPSVTVKNSKGTTLTKDASYTVTYVSGRKNVGTYTVTIKGKGNYTGTKTLSFKINPASIGTCKLSATSYTYDGKVKTPSVTVKNSKGTTLTKNASYTVTYASGRKYVNKYKVTVKGKGNYTGTKTLYFTINPPKTTVSKLTAGKKSIKVTVGKKTSQVTGYQIQYSTSKKFTSPKTKNITSYKTTSTTLTKLTSKKTYYVRVRTYKTVSGKKYYSGWSTYKSAKAK